jgi:hypothetical protein
VCDVSAQVRGRKSYSEREGGHELIAAARELHANPDGRAPSLRKVAASLAERGFVTPHADGTIQHRQRPRCSRGKEKSHTIRSYQTTRPHCAAFGSVFRVRAG